MALAADRPLTAVAAAALAAGVALGLTGCGDRDALPALEQRVGALEAAAMPTAAPDPESGVLIQQLTGPEALGCVVTVTSQALHALYAYDARWDSFTDDIAVLDWAPSSPCRWYTAIRVVPFTSDGTKVQVEVVITRGEHTGRRWVSDLADEPHEVAPWDAADLEAGLQKGSWRGDL